MRNFIAAGIGFVLLLASCTNSISDNTTTVVVVDGIPYRVQIDFKAMYRRQIEKEYAGSIDPKLDIMPSLARSISILALDLTNDEFNQMIDNGDLAKKVDSVMKEDRYTEGIHVNVKRIELVQP